MRDRIKEIITDLCLVECENNFGDTWLEQAFTFSQMITTEDIKCLFDGLREIMTDNLFETALHPSVIFSAIPNIQNKLYISMSALQQALSLYEDVCNKYEEYLPQFFSAAANIFNNNYQEAKNSFTELDDDDLPF
jgi:hypothetical protein